MERHRAQDEAAIQAGLSGELHRKLNLTSHDPE